MFRRKFLSIISTITGLAFVGRVNSNDANVTTAKLGKTIFHIKDGQIVLIEYANGDKEWYLDGELHRVDGPAIEYVNGDKCWCLNDKKHRIDGPAIEYANGTKEWYLDGKLYRYERSANIGDEPGPLSR